MTLTCCCGTTCDDGGVFGNIGDCCTATPTNIDVTIPNDFTGLSGGCDQCPSIGGTYTLSATGGNTTLACTFPAPSHGYGPGTEYSYSSANFCLVGTAPFQVWHDLLITATFSCQSGVCYLTVVVTLHANNMLSSCSWTDWRYVLTFSRGTGCDSYTFTVPYSSELDYSNSVGGPASPFCTISGTPSDITAVCY